MKLSIRSRHPSCSSLRKKVNIIGRAVYRHGSTTKGDFEREINSIAGVQCSASKLKMKQAFDKGEVKHLPWARLSEVKVAGKALVKDRQAFSFPIVLKNIFGSRGRGNYKINTVAEFEEAIKGKDLNNYIIEEFFSGTREYRVHITAAGSIYNLRKLLKSDTPKEKRWVRNDETCIWICEYPPSRDQNENFLGFQNEPSKEFDKPVNWDAIVNECQKALKAVGLDIGAVDLKVQSAKSNKSNPDFYIIEINSAPALGKITTEVYKQELPKILEQKYGKYNPSRTVATELDVPQPRNTRGIQKKVARKIPRVSTKS